MRHLQNGRTLTNALMATFIAAGTATSALAQNTEPHAGMLRFPDVIDTLQCLPAALEAGDIEDFCSLAQYYATKTPQSFRTVSGHLVPLCMSTLCLKL